MEIVREQEQRPFRIGLAGTAFLLIRKMTVCGTCIEDRGAVPSREGAAPEMAGPERYAMRRAEENVMDHWLMEQLHTITPEERAYLDGNVPVIKDIYTKKDAFEIDHSLFLRKEKLVTVRQHSRFIAFPEHSHDYVEIMYVCSGTITHYIGGREIVLEKGDMLFLNQHARHSVKRAEFDDIGINFIALPEFFDIPLQILRKRNVIADFLVSTLGGADPGPRYLVFQLKDHRMIENLMENMITSIVQENADEDVINQYSMGLVFLYLINHMDSLKEGSFHSCQDVIVQAALNYIATQYQTATLYQIAENFHQSVSVLSKTIKQATGFTFQELLIYKRCQKSAALLIDTSLPVEEIIAAVGYENQSHFYRIFKKEYGMTPKQYRTAYKNKQLRR